MFWFRLKRQRRASYADEIDVSEKGTCPESGAGQVLGRSEAGPLREPDGGTPTPARNNRSLARFPGARPTVAPGTKFYCAAAAAARVPSPNRIGSAMPTPVKLTDDELDAVFRAAAPLAVEDRDQFLCDVAAELRGREVGPGLVARVCVEVQKRYLFAPDLSRAAGGTTRIKYR